MTLSCCSSSHTMLLHLPFILLKSMLPAYSNLTFLSSLFSLLRTRSTCDAHIWLPGLLSVAFTELHMLKAPLDRLQNYGLESVSTARGIYMCLELPMSNTPGKYWIKKLGYLKNYGCYQEMEIKHLIFLNRKYVFFSKYLSSLQTMHS